MTNLFDIGVEINRRNDAAVGLRGFLSDFRGVRREIAQTQSALDKMRSVAFGANRRTIADASAGGLSYAAGAPERIARGFQCVHAISVSSTRVQKDYAAVLHALSAAQRSATGEEFLPISLPQRWHSGVSGTSAISFGMNRTSWARSDNDQRVDGTAGRAKSGEMLGPKERPGALNGRPLLPRAVDSLMTTLNYRPRTLSSSLQRLWIVGSGALAAGSSENLVALAGDGQQAMGRTRRRAIAARRSAALVRRSAAQLELSRLWSNAAATESAILGHSAIVRGGGSTWLQGVLVPARESSSEYEGAREAATRASELTGVSRAIGGTIEALGSVEPGLRAFFARPDTFTVRGMTPSIQGMIRTLVASAFPVGEGRPSTPVTAKLTEISDRLPESSGGTIVGHRTQRRRELAGYNPGNSLRVLIGDRAAANALGVLRWSATFVNPALRGPTRGLLATLVGAGVAASAPATAPDVDVNVGRALRKTSTFHRMDRRGVARVKDGVKPGIGGTGIETAHLDAFRREAIDGFFKARYLSSAPFNIGDAVQVDIARTIGHRARQSLLVSPPRRISSLRPESQGIVAPLRNAPIPSASSRECITVQAPITVQVQAPSISADELETALSAAMLAGMTPGMVRAMAHTIALQSGSEITDIVKRNLRAERRNDARGSMLDRDNTDTYPGESGELH